MQKTKVLCLILAMVLASAGTVSLAIKSGEDTIPPAMPDNAVNTVMDKPEEGTPSDRTAIENLYIAQGELQRKGGFVGTTVGTAVSAGISQNVYNNRVVIGNSVFKEMITIGIVKNAYQLYIDGDNYLYRKPDSIKAADNIKWADTASRYAKDDFLEKFGHRSDALTGYILNDDTIVSGDLEKEENGLYTYRYVLDINTAPARMLYEMRTNSNMSGFSTFSKAEIVVTMDADWQVKTLRTDCKYKVPMFGGVNCIEDVTETFSDLTSDQLPEKDFFEKFVNADITKPVEDQADALSVLMDIFAPYASGENNLNVSLNAQLNGQPVLTGMLSAKIDIENISNIEVAAKIGDELYIEYQQGALYVTYQDFKASTTVDGIIGAVSALIPSSDNGANADAEDGFDDILSKFTYSVKDNLCTVNLPLTVGEEKLNVNIYANVNDNKYEFIGAEVTLGSLKLDIDPAAEFAAHEREGEYPEIIGLLDIVQNGIISGNISAFGKDIDVMFDLASASLYATGDGIEALYRDNIVYARLGAIKAKLNIDDIDDIMTVLRLSGIIDNDVSVELPQISIGEILAVLGNVNAKSTENGVAFNMSVNDLSVAIYLSSAANGWTVDSITVTFGGNVITLAPSAPTVEIPQVDSSDYADVTEMINTYIRPIASIAMANSYGIDLSSTLTVDGKIYNIEGTLTYDVNKNINVNAVAYNDTAKLIKADITIANGIVYVDINGLKTAFAADNMNGDIDLSKIVGAVYGSYESIDGIIDTVETVVNAVGDFDIASIDLSAIFKQFSFADGVVTLTVNTEFIGLSSDVELRLFVNGDGNLALQLGGLQIGGVGLDIQAAAVANVEDVVIPDVSEYVINLAGSVNDVTFAVTADLLNMEVSAEINVLSKTVLARYTEGKVYAALDDIALVANVNQIGALVSKIMAELGAETLALPEIDLSVKDILDAIKIDMDGSALSVGLALGEITAKVNFDNTAEFVNITAELGNYNLTIEKSDKQVTQLDINQTFIPVESLADQLLEIYGNFKDVLNTGIAAELKSNVVIDGTEYNLTATVNYRNGLHLTAVVSDSTNVFVNADVYFVDNVLYLDVNGIRVSTQLNTNVQSTQSAVDVNGIIAAVNQLKGYNAVLDSVIDVIAELPTKLEGINYLDLLTSLTYADNTLTAVINGKLLGLSEFEVSVAGANNVTASINGLEIGKVNIRNLSVNAFAACDEVVAPASEYITELQIEAAGITAIAKLDLYNKTVTATATLFNNELAICYADGAVYVKYSGVNAMLNLADIDRIIAVVKSFTATELPQISLDLNFEEIIKSISVTSSDNGFKAALSISNVNLEAAFDSSAQFTSAQAIVNETVITVNAIEGADYPVFDLNANYDNIADILELYAGEIKQLIDASGYNVTLQGAFAFGSNKYDVTANVIYNNGLQVNAEVYYNANEMINVDLWLVDNVVYARIGDLKLALNLSSGSSTNNSNISIADLKGYNTSLDGILDIVQSIIDKFNSNEINYSELLGGLSYTDGMLTLDIDGTELGISQPTLQIYAANGLTVNVKNFAIGDMKAELTAGISVCSESVAAPNGDFTTNLSVKIDDYNTVYANLDLINNVFNFKLDDMYVKYSENVVKINKGDMYICGDINKISDMVNKINDLVNEFSGAASSALPSIDLSAFANIDIKEIVKSLTIQTVGEGTSVCAKALGFDINVMFAVGELNQITVPVGFINKTLVIKSGEAKQYAEFGNDVQYIAIEQIFDDYYSSFEKLVKTNSWKFAFDGDTMLTLGNVEYKVVAGSYLEFYYKNTEGMDTFKLRAHIDVRKHKDDNSWQEFMLIDIVYKDGNIYVSDTGRKVGNNGRNTIKLTISVDTIKKCVVLYDDLVKVVPQIGELVDKVLAAMAEAESNSQCMSFANILSDASYGNGVFALVLNGKAILSKLGEVALSVQQYGDGLSLNDLELHYDTISVKVTNLRVTASAIVETDGVSEYETVNDINEYDTTGHMDFNSLYELLSSFVITATPADGANTRSFYIDGTASVSLSLGKINLADIPIGMSVKVDIDENNKVFITAKIHRTNPEGGLLNLVKVYDDKGGDSYLYYDGVNETFTVIRNSVFEKKAMVPETKYKWHCTKCDKDRATEWCVTVENWSTHGKKYMVQVPYEEQVEKLVDYIEERNFAAENLTTTQFMANIFDYIMEMFNFSSTIEDPIREALQKENNNDFGIEDIIKNYSYTAEQKVYSVNTDLSAIDSNLGTVDITVYHADDFSLTSLHVDAALLKGMCKAKVPLDLKTSVYGEATDIVKEVRYW